MPIYLPSIGHTGLANAASLAAAGEVAPQPGDQLRMQTHAPFTDKDIDPLAWMPHLGSFALERFINQK